MRHCLLLFCFIFRLLPAGAQTGFESLEVVFTQPFYLTGETARFTVWFTGKEEQPGSRIVRFELMNNEGEVLQRKRLPRREDYATGTCFLPLEIPTGYYTFRFYTLHNLNYPGQNYQDIILPVYSSVNPPTVKTVAVRPPQAPSDAVLFSPAERSYKRDELIKIPLDFGIRDSVIWSVTVSDKNWLTEGFNSFFFAAPVMHPPAADRYPLETEPYYEFDLINPEDGNPFASRYILLTQPDRGRFQKTATTIGKIAFTLPSFTDAQEIQIHNLNPYLPFIPLAKEVFPVLPAPVVHEPPTADSSVLHYYQLTQKARKIREIYPPAVSAKSFADSTGQTSSAVPYKKYFTDDYIDLRNLEEFIANIVSGALVKKKAGAKTVRLSNKDNFRQYLNAPVYFVNGYLAGNEAEILNIPLSQIKTVEVFSTRASVLSAFPDFMLGMGVISVTTKKNTVPRSISDTFNNFTVQGLSSVQTLPNEPVNGNVPSFRPVIFHADGLYSDADGKAVLSFYPGSATGEHLISVHYKDAEGHLRNMQTVIEVVR